MRAPHVLADCAAGLLVMLKLIGWVKSTHKRKLVHRDTPFMARMSVQFAHSFLAALPMMLRLTFLCFPIVTSLAFKAFICIDLDEIDDAPGPAVMANDFDVTCWGADGIYTEEYSRIRSIAYAAPHRARPQPAACTRRGCPWRVRPCTPPRAPRRSWVAIVLYPILLPLSYGYLLFKVRHAVWKDQPTELSASVEFLTSEYDAPYFFWELIEGRETPPPPLHSASPIAITPPPSARPKRRRCSRSCCWSGS